MQEKKSSKQKTPFHSSSLETAGQRKEYEFLLQRDQEFTELAERKSSIKKPMFVDRPV
jgi:hypothetical protein